MTSAPRPRIAVASAVCTIAAPIVVQAAARLLSTWTGAPHPALPVTLAALAPSVLAGAVALVRGAPLAIVGWIAAAIAGAVLLGLGVAPLPALVAAALGGWISARWLPRLATVAPVPRGRLTAGAWFLLALVVAAQAARMSVFMADPQQTWGALAPAGFVARHSCLSSYVHGAELARRGDANIYDDRYAFSEDDPGPVLPSAIDTGPLTMDSYEYPPQFLALPRALLLVARDFLGLRALWFALTIATVVFVSLALARWLAGDAERRARLLIPAIAVSPPLLLTTYFGNFQPMAMGLSALAMLCISTGRTRRGAALLAFTISAKIFPGILGIYLLAARRYAAAAWTAAFAALYGLLALAWFGTRPFVDFFTYHLPRLASGETFAFLSEPMASMSNLGVFGLPFKLRIAGWSGSEADAWALARQFAWGYTLVLVVLAAWAGWRARGPEDPHARASLVGVWFALLGLGALRSPFAPPEAIIPIIWALALRAAAARTRGEATLLTILWIAVMAVIPVPVAPAAIASLILQAVLYTTAIGLVITSRARNST